MLFYRNKIMGLETRIMQLQNEVVEATMSKQARESELQQRLSSQVSEFQSTRDLIQKQLVDAQNEVEKLKTETTRLHTEYSSRKQDSSVDLSSEEVQQHVAERVQLAEKRLEEDQNSLKMAHAQAVASKDAEIEALKTAAASAGSKVSEDDFKMLMQDVFVKAGELFSPGGKIYVEDFNSMFIQLSLLLLLLLSQCAIC
jgi:hypothetical protein